MKILISAYACEPNRGSEPGIGWYTAIGLGKIHDVWVVTDAGQRDAIERELAMNPQPRVRFVYYQFPCALKVRNANGLYIQIHYYLWQWCVYSQAKRLHREHDFDLAFHATFGRYWSPSLFSFLPIPFVWSAEGGETIPKAFRKGIGAGGRWWEFLKDNLLRIGRYDPLWRQTVRRTALVIAGSDKTVTELNRIARPPMMMMEHTIIDDDAIDIIESVEPMSSGLDPAMVYFASMTGLIPAKGVHLALHAFHRLEIPNARYWVVGEGPQQAELEQLVRQLGIEDRVVFWGYPSRTDWMQMLKSADSLVHTPLCGNIFNPIVLEAMIAAKPIISLTLGDMAERLNENNSYPVKGSTPEVVIQGLVRAMQSVADDPREAARRGRSGRELALETLTTDTRIARLNRAFQDVVGSER